MRHRRRCRGSQKPPTRRRACNACVQAKAKCSYTQPSCSRCAARGAPCEYLSTAPEAAAKFTRLEDPRELAGPDEASWPLENFQLSPFELSMSGFPDLTQDHVDCSLQDLVHLLGQYPKSLLRHDFCSPFLHRALYEQEVPDMATLVKSSMAICCGSAMETTDGIRFARHAMDVERQRLIESYPSYQCMQQLDALHAMLIYGILELRASSEDTKEDWKQKTHAKGLKSPFLAKMTKGFIHSHLDASDRGLMLGSTQSLLYTWVQWQVAETARRTIFLANIVHFLSNYDLEGGRQSPYYEPLDDELILNLPLPCSHALWSARTDQDWTLTKDFSENNASSTDLFSAFQLGSDTMTLGYLLSNFSKEYLLANLVHTAGFGGSDELRAFVILCALKQFS
ncbi:hypothetical protein NUU61_008396 [Penicillium alfredii]|uniref:Zn(2)-C6 fungal-type domain-containing protein n=1 Tax=Penicillium alfredii TaxID=1506179 RepID=A0A9W9JZ05_9EURO|nr:uncharacterized protein NUU61_008396 [Penicillium alfredii]KAJ5087089.1 hypothetical protein NUU61_008396 [Penicillium alfredii]